MSKRIAIIGATGLTGREVIKHALEAGYSVRAIARDPARIAAQDHLVVQPADITDFNSLRKALVDIDAVISCFGPANDRKPGNIMSHGTSNLVKACEANGISTLVFMSGILQSHGHELTFLNRVGLNLIRHFYKKVFNDKIKAEQTIQESKLDWVIVRAVGLAQLPATG